jgi:hypothetical protein
MLSVKIAGSTAYEVARVIAEEKAKLLEKAQEGLNQIRNFTPVDTGAAKASWDLEVHKGKVTLVNDKEYIFYVNYGTSEIAPRYFIEHALATLGTPTYPVADKKD